MVPRGEVGIVVANLALAAEVVDDSLFAAIVVAVLLTTVIAPYLLSFSIPRAIRETGDTDTASDESGVAAAGP